MRTIAELTIRRTLCDGIIRTLLQPDMVNDPRQPEALDHYRKQLKALDKELAQAEREYRQAHGIPEPEPIVVNLKPGRLFGEAKSIGSK